MERARALPLALLSVLLVLLLALLPASPAGASPADEERPVVFPTIVARAAAAAGFVPAGWVLEAESRGDLNGDGAADLLLVLLMTDRRNVVQEEPDGPELDTNPRMLVIAFAEAEQGFALALADHTLIPRHTHPSMEPPFEKAVVAGGTVQVSLGLFMTAGGWYTSNVKLTFRHQDGCFRLIGYDSRVLKRNTGEIQSVSINYLTGKAKVGKGDAETDQETFSWKNLESSRRLCLGAIGDGLDFESEYRPFP